jgi:hypothetical protein
MAEPTPVLAAGQPAEAPAYRSLSILAVAALVIAAGFAALVSILGVTAFVTETPLFMGNLSFLIPVTSLVMAVAARHRIRRSEGVLTGVALTTWAWWLSLLFGLGYGAFYLGTFLAVWAQAEAFTEKWFNLLREGKINEAFLKTVEPARRKHDRPLDREYMFEHYGAATVGAKGPLALFADDEVVRIVEQAGPDAEIKFLGVKDWSYERGYKVTVSYRITCREGVFIVAVVVQSTEGQEVEGRQWQVNFGLTHMLPPPQLSPFGESLRHWRQQAASFTKSWITQWEAGNLAGNYLESLTPVEREKLRQEFFTQLVVAELSASPAEQGALPLSAMTCMAHLGNPEARLSYLRGYQEFLGGNLLKSDDFQAPSKMRTDILQQVRDVFHDLSHLRLRMPKEATGRPRPIGPDPKTIEIAQDVGIAVFPGGQTDADPKYQVDSVFIIEVKVGPDAPADIAGCRLVSIELLRGGTPSPAKKK